MEERPPDAERARWLEQLADAAQLAIGRLRELDDPDHAALVDDLQMFHERLVASWGDNFARMDERAKRVGENEVLFREINERLRDLGESFSLVSDTTEFVCECANTSCTERVRMTLPSYEEVRSDPKRFFVIKGHEQPEYEKVVGENEHYLIVEKLPGGPAGIAIRDDPRS